MLRHLKKLGCLMLSYVMGRIWVARQMGVKVGQRCRLLTIDFGDEPWLISMGDKVTVTAGVRFVTHDGSTWLMEDNQGRRYHYARIEIGNEVFIGINSILMPGVRIGEQCIIGAGSVVTKSVPSGCIVAGNPARIIGSYNEYRARVLEGYPTQADMKGDSYRERIESIANSCYRSECK